MMSLLQNYSSNLKLTFVVFTSAPSIVSGYALRVSNANNVTTTVLRQYMGLPKFLRAPLLTCHSLRTPEALHIFAIHRMLLCWLQCTLKPSPTSIFISKLCQLSGYAVTPTACKIFCVRFVWIVHKNSTRSASDATLDTGGWLDLTGQGLAPCKAHQASLGALTTKLNS
jgi:hypothetical protein